MKIVKSVLASRLTMPHTRCPLDKTSLCQAPWKYGILKKAGSVTCGLQGVPQIEPYGMSEVGSVTCYRNGKDLGNPDEIKLNNTFVHCRNSLICYLMNLKDRNLACSIYYPNAFDPGNLLFHGEACKVENDRKAVLGYRSADFMASVF